MQFSAELTIFIVKTYLNSIFTSDLKRKLNFSKMFIVTDLVSLNTDSVSGTGAVTQVRQNVKKNAQSMGRHRKSPR